MRSKSPLFLIAIVTGALWCDVAYSNPAMIASTVIEVPDQIAVLSSAIAQGMTLPLGSLLKDVPIGVEARFLREGLGLLVQSEQQLPSIGRASTERLLLQLRPGLIDEIYRGRKGFLDNFSINHRAVYSRDQYLRLVRTVIQGRGALTREWLDGLPQKDRMQLRAILGESQIDRNAEQTAVQALRGLSWNTFRELVWKLRFSRDQHAVSTLPSPEALRADLARFRISEEGQQHLLLQSSAILLAFSPFFSLGPNSTVLLPPDTTISHADHEQLFQVANVIGDYLTEHPVQGGRASYSLDYGSEETLATQLRIIRDLLGHPNLSVGEPVEDGANPSPLLPELLLYVDNLHLPTSVNSVFRQFNWGGSENGLGIRLIGDLVQQKPGDLLRRRNFGRSSLDQVEAALAKMGLSLGMQLDAATVAAIASPVPSAQVREVLLKSVDKLDVKTTVRDILKSNGMNVIGQVVLAEMPVFYNLLELGIGGRDQVFRALAQLGLQPEMRFDRETLAAIAEAGASRP